MVLDRDGKNISDKIGNLNEQLAQTAIDIDILSKNQISVLKYQNLKVAVLGGYDWQPAIQKAIDDVYANGGGTVFLPKIVEVYGVGKTPIRFRENVSFIGSGSRFCKLKR